MACFGRMAVHLDIAADRHVVDRNAGVLAQQVFMVLGDADVRAHGLQHAARGVEAFRLRQPVDPPP